MVISVAVVVLGAALEVVVLVEAIGVGRWALPVPRRNRRQEQDERHNSRCNADAVRVDATIGPLGSCAVVDGLTCLILANLMETVSL